MFIIVWSTGNFWIRLLVVICQWCSFDEIGTDREFLASTTTRDYEEAKVWLAVNSLKSNDNKTQEIVFTLKKQCSYKKCQVPQFFTWYKANIESVYTQRVN